MKEKLELTYKNKLMHLWSPPYLKFCGLSWHTTHFVPLRIGLDCLIEHEQYIIKRFGGEPFDGWTPKNSEELEYWNNVYDVERLQRTIVKTCNQIEKNTYTRVERNLSDANLNLLEAQKKGYRINKDGKILNPKGKILNGTIHTTGRRQFSMKDSNGHTIKIMVHKLQAFQMFGQKMFEEGIQVRHLDNDCLNNAVYNIDIGTQSENMMDRPKEERRRNASNPKHDHEAIIRDHKAGFNYAQLMRKYNISSKGTISHIIKNSLKSQNACKDVCKDTQEGGSGDHQ